MSIVKFSKFELFRGIIINKNFSYGCVTIWKFKNFPTTQILREINFGESDLSKNSLFDISAFKNAEINKFLFQSPEK